LPIKRIFSAIDGEIKLVGSIDTLIVYAVFHSSSLPSSSVPSLSGSIVRIVPTMLRFEMLPTEVGFALLLPLDISKFPAPSTLGEALA
jgi:hypothetical protein